MIGALIGGAVAFSILVCLILYGATREDDLESDIEAMHRDFEWRKISPEERHAYRRWCTSARRDPLAEESWEAWEGVKREIMEERLNKKTDAVMECIKQMNKVLIGVGLFVLAFCVCCLDTDPYPGWLFPVMAVAVVGLVIGFIELSMWGD